MKIPLDPEQVPEWYDLGLRMVSISHYGTSAYCHGTGMVGGGAVPDQGCARAACGTSASAIETINTVTRSIFLSPGCEFGDRSHGVGGES